MRDEIFVIYCLDCKKRSEDVTNNGACVHCGSSNWTDQERVIE